jgi:hypothetical protein
MLSTGRLKRLAPISQKARQRKENWPRPGGLTVT